MSTKPEYQALKEKLKSGQLSRVGATSVSWYGDDQVWKLDKTRWDLSEQKELEELHNFIHDQDRLRNIYRQEQVSMVPVKCLDIKPDHIVLDMCASPGSKTGQVLEALHSGAGSDLPTGCVVACEPDVGRCSNLCGNMNLYQSPCVMVINHTGQTIPDITHNDGTPVLYDHIVCDVPCSGDGTIRKNPNIWANWNPGKGNGRFNLQLNIARRGLELLKEGGTMAYSSCSINQVENEAVVARLLIEAKGNLELVDMTGKFPGLNWLPGLSDWKIFDSQMNEWAKMEDVPANLRTSIRPEMFPPQASEAKALRLERCMRFLPHLNDDGGFFVAILKKTGPFQVDTRLKDRWQRKKESIPAQKFNKHKLDQLHFSVDDDFTFMPYSSLENEVVRSLEYHGLDLPTNNMYTVNKSSNTVHLVSSALRSILHSGNNKLNIASTPGVPILSANNLSCASENPFFVKGSSYHLIADSVEKRIVSGTLQDASLLLNSPIEKTVEVKHFSDNMRDTLMSLETGWFTFKLRTDKFVLQCPGYTSGRKVFLRLNDRSRNHYKCLLEC